MRISLLSTCRIFDCSLALFVSNLRSFLWDIVLANAWVTQFDIRSKIMKSKFFCRHIDDIIITLPEDVIKENIRSISKWHKNCGLTYEAENKKREINFLDFTIIRNKDHRIKSKWLRSPTNNGITLDFHTIAPTNTSYLL